VIILLARVFMSDDKSKLAATALKCLQEFEELTSKFYEKLSALSNDEVAVLAFKWLSVESNSHAVLMQNIYDLLGVGASDIECSKLVGEPWRKLELLANSIGSGGRLDILEVLNKMEFVEGFVGEEMYGRLLYSILDVLLVDTLSAELAGLVKELLSEIAKEEEYHASIVNLLRHFEEVRRSKTSKQLNEV